MRPCGIDDAGDEDFEGGILDPEEDSGGGDWPRPLGDGDLRRDPPPRLLPFELVGVGGISPVLPPLAATLPEVLPLFEGPFLGSAPRLQLRRLRWFSDSELPPPFEADARAEP